MANPQEEDTTNRVSPRSIDAAAKPPQRFRHTEAALDRLSIRRLIANEQIDVDDVLAGLERDSQTGTMKEIVEELHCRSLDDRQFSIKLSVLARPDMIKPKDELNVTGLQIILIRIIQRTYEDRKKLKESSRKRYRNALSLSGEFYHRYCAADASFFRLNAPLIAWLRDLLRDTEEEDVELVARQLSINGQLLLRRAEKELNELVRRVKHHLVHRNLSAKSRTLLLYVVDLANRDFAPLRGEQRDFYARQLGDATFVDFEFCGRHVVDDDLVVSQQQQQQTTCSRSVLVARHPQSHFKPVRSDRLPMKPRTRYDPSKPIVVPKPKSTQTTTTTTTTTTSSEDSFDRLAKAKSDALALASRRRRDQRSGQRDPKAERSRQQHQRARICKSFNKDRKPIRDPPPSAASRQQQQRRLDRGSSQPPLNGGSGNNNARDKATATKADNDEKTKVNDVEHVGIAFKCASWADDEKTKVKEVEHVGIAFKCASWADDLPDEEDDEFVETPEWYKKSTDESSRSEKENKSGDSKRNTSNKTSDSSNSSSSGHMSLPVTKPKRYSERRSRRGDKRSNFNIPDENPKP